MVSSEQKKILQCIFELLILIVCFTHESTFNFQFLTDHWSSFAKIIYIPQTATKDVKDEMKIKLHMDGDVNGCKFKIEGNGQGRPYE